jgi:tetratricopeptide (TPR) repeat protein
VAKGDDNRAMSASGDDPLDESDDELSAETLFERAMMLKTADRWQDAADGFDTVITRLGNAVADQHDLRRRAMVTKIACLDELGRSEATVVACDDYLARYGDDESDFEIGLLADVLWIKSRALNRDGARDKEREVLQRLIAEFADGDTALGPVAGAMYNEGIYLRDDDHGDQAVALWDQLWARSAREWPTTAGFTPIRGQLAKSTYLARTGQLDRALLTCEHMLAECQRRSLPDDEVRQAQRRCIAIARRNQGVAAKLRRLLKLG